MGHAEKILPGGETLVRVDGESVLVANAVPGDVLTLKLSGKRRGAQRGEIIEIERPSRQRVTPPCPVANECGGCALQFVSQEHQAIEKSNWVSDAFKSCMDGQIDWTPAPTQVNRQRYRRRVRWFVGRDEQGFYLGFYAPASHRPVRNADCMVLSPALNGVRHIIEDGMNPDAIDSVQAIELNDGMHVILEAERCPENIPVDHIGSVALQWWWRNKQQITRPLHKPVQAFHDLLPAGRTHVSLAVGPDDFVQGQDEGNRKLIAQIQDWAGAVNRIADLFCGIGNLSLPLAATMDVQNGAQTDSQIGGKIGAHVYGAELNAASVRAASKNAKQLGLNASFEVANLFESFDTEPYIGADVLILDPPRRGGKRVCSLMSRLLPKKIIMISCDAAAGARDGKILKQQGYRLKALRALDLFPYAGHVETMSLWEPD